MADVLIVGGGAIGLSLAYELAGDGLSVRLLEAGQPGRESSWAGAGILMPAGLHPVDPLGQLFALSNQLHAHWHAQLLAETGIDNGYRLSGGVYLARDEAGQAALDESIRAWRRDGIEAQQLPDGSALADIEPGLALQPPARGAWFLPEERQIRNPRHLQALLAACLARGVEVSVGLPAEDFEVEGSRIRGVRTAEGLLGADRYCIAGGAWSAALVARLGVTLPVWPVRGQIALVSLPTSPLARIVNEGPRYLVPRGDGRVLIGSTEENAGFDRNPTAGAIGELLSFAFSLVPALAAGKIERCWAGLRPGSRDGHPYLGRVPGYDNIYLAAGHHRHGLQLSTGTAAVMGRLLRGAPSPIDLAPFALKSESKEMGG